MTPPEPDYRCRSCGSGDIAPMLSLGETPLANSLLREEQLAQHEPRFPLDVVVCRECRLVQITVSVPPERLFGEYLYFSSFSDTMLTHARELVQRLVRERGLGPQSLAAEVASNDGYLLQFYRDAGVPVLGIEPAANIAGVAREKGIRTECAFFGLDLARDLSGRGEYADVIHANNVLAHVPDLNGFVEGIRVVLKPGGVAVIEAPYVKDLIDHVEFDTIYHEHLCYFSLAALDRLFSRHGLTLFDAEHLPIHGGSLRVYLRHSGSSASAPERSERLQALMRDEAAWGVDDDCTYTRFAARVQALRRELLDLLTTLKADGKRIAAYGASAKGSTLLNCFGIGRETLDFVVDRSTHKQGLYTPGTHLPIYSPDRLLESMPDAVLLLTWNFADEILQQQDEYRRSGGKFIIPVPQPRIV